MSAQKIFINRSFYALKPIIPRFLQLALRRQIAMQKWRKNKNIWPIDESATKVPNAWGGWPHKKKFAFILMHDVDTAKGQAQSIRLMELEKQMGFRSSFYFVPERYPIQKDKRDILLANKFGVGVHGLKHDGKLFISRDVFNRQAPKINHYLREWGVRGFSSPSMLHNHEWMLDLNIDFSTSSFDTDPFEPQPEGMHTIFPFWVSNKENTRRFLELPYTLVQDFTLFIILCEKNINIWKQKLDWIAEQGGMALLNSHPDYMNFDNRKCSSEEYPVKFYREFLEYVQTRYTGQFWHVLPKTMADFWNISARKKSTTVKKENVLYCDVIMDTVSLNTH